MSVKLLSIWSTRPSILVLIIVKIWQVRPNDRARNFENRGIKEVEDSYRGINEYNANSRRMLPTTSILAIAEKCSDQEKLTPNNNLLIYAQE